MGRAPQPHGRAGVRHMELWGLAMDTSQSALLEVVKLANGRYTVRAVGETSPDNDAGEFATQAGAEAWMFERTQVLDGRSNDLGVLKPGQGQGL